MIKHMVYGGGFLFVAARISGTDHIYRGAPGADGWEWTEIPWDATPAEEREMLRSLRPYQSHSPYQGGCGA